MPILPFEETLANFADQLEGKFEAVNKRIEQMANQHVKVRGGGEKRRWTLASPSSEEPVNGPFYSKVPGINVADLLTFVARDTKFIDAFTHVLERYVKQAPAPSPRIDRLRSCHGHQYGARQDGTRVRAQPGCAYEHRPQLFAAGDAARGQ